MPQNFPVPITLPEEDTLIEFPWARLKKLDETVRGLGQMNTPDRDIVRKKLKETMKALIVSIEDAKWVNCDAYDAKKEKEEDIQCDMIELKKFELPLAKEEYRKAKKIGMELQCTMFGYIKSCPRRWMLIKIL
ncbi:hypothetical protein OCU04_001821 [Sclerotinia nivalis]|uniref:Uncharacterized protein n=1 Tax=Sclerotinia nivalis TaxID=352851 RepID=A0A9X0AYW3_9HELO|nr:hypothetical protein OCU04_001821 [Sclerotinia nivalis]